MSRSICSRRSGLASHSTTAEFLYDSSPPRLDTVSDGCSIVQSPVHRNRNVSVSWTEAVDPIGVASYDVKFFYCDAPRTVLAEAMGLSPYLRRIQVRLPSSATP